MSRSGNKKIDSHILIIIKKNYSRALLLLLCLFFAAIACIPQPGDPIEEEYLGTIDFSKYEQIYDELPGRWSWIRTTIFDTIDGIPETETPLNTGIRKVLEISEDHQIEFVQDDTISVTEPLESFLQNNDWGIRGDTLATKSKAYAGPETVYIRIEEE